MASEEDIEVINDLEATIRDLRSRIEALERGGDSTHLDNTSLENGTLQVNNQDGRGMQFIGRQSDDTFAISYKDGPAPKVPSDPTVSARQLAIAVAWNREMADGSDLPSNLAQVDVHASETSGFTHDGTTIVGSMPITENTALAEIGRVLMFATGGVTTHYVKLVAVNTSGVESAPSNEVSVTPLPAGEIAADVVTADTIASEAITGKIITGGLFRTAASGQRIEIDANTSNRKVFFVSSAGGTAEIRQYDATVAQEVYSGLVVQSEPYSGLTFTLDMHPSVGPRLTATNSVGDTGKIGIEQGQIALQPLGSNSTIIGHSTGRYLEASGTEIIPWDSGSRDSMSVHAESFTFRSMGGIGHNLKVLGSSAGDGTPVIQSDYNVAIYFGNTSGGGGALYINRSAGDNTRCPVYAESFNTPSGANQKKNIQDLSLSGISVIRNAPTKTYEYKDSGSTSVGPLAEDLPGEVTDGDNVSLSAMVGILWAAIQELNTKVDNISPS